MKRLVNTLTVFLFLFSGLMNANANDEIKAKYTPFVKDVAGL